MKNLLRSELFRITHSTILLLLTLVVIIVNVFFSSRSKVNAMNMYSLPELSTASVFVNYCEERDMSVETAKMLMAQQDYFDLKSSKATTLLEVFEDMQPHQFTIILHSIKGMLFVPVLLLYLYIIQDFKNRSFYNSLYSGRSRTYIYLSKAVMFHAVAFIVSFISVILLSVFYASSVFSKLPAGYVWGRICLYALMDTAILSVAFMLTFVLRKPMLSITGVLIYSVLIRFSPSIFWPAALKSEAGMTLWTQSASSAQIGTAVLSSVVFIAVSLVIGWFAFEKADLK